MNEQQKNKTPNLNKDRFLFGIGNILFQGEEAGLGPVPTAMVRYLGGDDRHVGLIGSSGSIMMLGQLFGNYILSKTKSNQRAMIITMWFGLIITLTTGLIFIVSGFTHMKTPFLYSFLTLFSLFSLLTGLQMNIESSWIRDLVAVERRGWFTKVKWVMSTCGIITFGYLISRIADRFPSSVGYGMVFGLFGISFLFAARFVYPKTSDCLPNPISFAGRNVGKTDRLAIFDSIYISSVLMGVLWGLGRGTSIAFMPTVMLDRFHMTLTQITYVMILGSFVSIGFMLLIGDRSDKWGARKPLLVVMLICALSMVLWPLSRYYGIGCVISYYLINGLSGPALAMLWTNFLLEIFPQKGCAAYLGVYKAINAVSGVVGLVISSFMLHHYRGAEIMIMNHQLTTYDVLILLCVPVSLSALIPALYIGNRKVLGL